MERVREKRERQEENGHRNGEEKRWRHSTLNRIQLLSAFYTELKDPDQQHLRMKKYLFYYTFV